MANNCLINPATGRAIKAGGRTAKKVIANRMGGMASRMAAAVRADTRALYGGARGIVAKPPAPAKKKRGRPKGSKNKPKK